MKYPAAIILGCLVLIHLAFLQQLPASGGAPQAVANSSEQEIRHDIATVYQSLAAKNINAYSALWCDRSPQFSTAGNIATTLISDLGRRASAPMQIGQLRINGKWAVARVHIQPSTLKSNAAVQSDPGTGNHTLVFLLDNGKWRVWHHAITVDDIASKIALAKSNAVAIGILKSERSIWGASLGRALVDKGDDDADQGHLDAAIDLFKLATSVAMEVGDLSGEGIAYNHAGYYYGGNHNYRMAIESYKAGLAAFKAKGDKFNIALSLNSIGDVLTSLNEFDAALGWLQPALKRFEEIPDNEGIVDTLNNLGLTYYNQGAYNQAESSYTRSYQLAKGTQGRPQSARSRNGSPRRMLFEGKRIWYGDRLF